MKKVKARTERKRSLPEQQGTPDKASLEHIERFYKLGQRSRTKYPERMAYGCTDEEAGCLGVSRNKLRLARRFCLLYNEEDLQKLLHMCRQHRGTFSVSHVMVLLGVPDRKTRAALQERAIADHWSYARMATQVKVLLGSRRSVGGRPRREMRDMDEASVEMQKASVNWLRTLNLLNNATPPPRRALINKLDAVAGPMRRLEDYLVKQLRRRAAG
jgi:hypothetical protein